jgi:hypothetical protein
VRRNWLVPLALAADLLASQLSASLGDCRRGCRARRMRCTPLARLPHGADTTDSRGPGGPVASKVLNLSPRGNKHVASVVLFF